MIATDFDKETGLPDRQIVREKVEENADLSEYCFFRCWDDYLLSSNLTRP